MKEVILEDSDVTKALVEYININCINNIVVGTSTRNAITRSLSGSFKLCNSFILTY